MPAVSSRAPRYRMRPLCAKKHRQWPRYRHDSMQAETPPISVSEQWQRDLHEEGIIEVDDTVNEEGVVKVYTDGSAKEVVQHLSENGVALAHQLVHTLGFQISTKSVVVCSTNGIASEVQAILKSHGIKLGVAKHASGSTSHSKFLSRVQATRQLCAQVSHLS